MKESFDNTSEIGNGPAIPESDHVLWWIKNAPDVQRLARTCIARAPGSDMKAAAGTFIDHLLRQGEYCTSDRVILTVANVSTAFSKFKD